MANYPRLRFTFRCDLARVINLICIVLYCKDTAVVVEPEGKLSPMNFCILHYCWHIGKLFNRYIRYDAH